MDLVTCKVALGGDTRQVVVKGKHNPVTYPEFLVLGFIHGEHAVYDMQVVGELEREPIEEKQRLRNKYGPIVEQVFPGIAPQFPGLPKKRGKAGAKAKDPVEDSKLFEGAGA